MKEHLQFYINGQWVDPVEPGKTWDVINPATEEPCGRIAMGSKADVDKAVVAARNAFPSYSQTSKEERLAIIGKYMEIYTSRLAEIEETISLELGAPTWLSKAVQAPLGLAHFNEIMNVLKDYEFQEQCGSALVVKEPIGVCGFITPWNFPINQIVCKVAPALAAGCTMVVKPSEETPLSAVLLAEILHDAGCPPGVFNLVNGDGPTVGSAISSHPDIDMVSFTGSTRAGIQVAKDAADTVKRVHQELGGKSANIICEDADIEKAVAGGVQSMMMNSGQVCTAPSRMFVPESKHDQAVQVAKATAESLPVGDPFAEGTNIGPVVNERQFDRVQGFIEQGIKEGADLVTGGTGRPEGYNKGYYVRPTIFANVNNDMVIAREEIFGPVLSIMPYKTEEEAIAMANDTTYGLAGYVQSGNPKHAQEVGSKIRAGTINLNGAGPDMAAPFGGYKQSGNGREWGQYGFEEFLEIKAVTGVQAA